MKRSSNITIGDCGLDFFLSGLRNDRSVKKIWGSIVAILLLCMPAARSQTLVDDFSFQAYVPPTSPVVRRDFEYVHEDGTRESIMLCDNRDAAAIKLFYAQLRANKKNGPVRNTKKYKGAFVRSLCKVVACDAVPKDSQYAAFEDSWWAWIELTHVFYLHNQTHFGIGLSNGTAEEMNGVRTSALRVSADATINWDAENQILSVVVSDWDNPFDTGVQFETGNTIITGRSVLSSTSTNSTVNTKWTQDIPKPDSDDETSEAPKQTIHISATSKRVDKKSRTLVKIFGPEYAAWFGRFSVFEWPMSDGDSRLEFSFTGGWITEAFLQLNEIASESYAECKSTRGFKTDVSFTDVLTGAAFEQKDSVKCSISASQVPMLVSWKAAPVRDGNTFEEEGLFSSIRWVVLSNADGSGESWYQPRSAQKMIWHFQAHPTEGAGGSINVSNNETSSWETQKKIYPRILD